MAGSLDSLANQPPPETAVNALASLRPSPIEVRAAGEWFVIPALTAVQWLELLMDDIDLAEVFPGLAGENAEEIINEALAEGFVSFEDIRELALLIIAEAAGRPWWVALRLISIVRTKWSVLGADMILQGVDPQRLSLSAWLDALWVTIFARVEKDKRLMIQSQIEAPPPGATVSEDDMEMSIEQFTSMMTG